MVQTNWWQKKQRTIQMLVFLTLSWYIKVSPQNKEIKLRNIEVVQDEFILLFEICWDWKDLRYVVITYVKQSQEIVKSSHFLQLVRKGLGRKRNVFALKGFRMTLYFWSVEVLISSRSSESIGVYRSGDSNWQIVKDSARFYNIIQV